MKKLGILDDYVMQFEQEDTVCYFEDYVGFWAWQKKDVYDKMRELEETYNLKVYAITHNYTTIGEMWSFLYVSRYKSDWKYEFYTCKEPSNSFAVSAYVWNYDDDFCSEFGSVGIRSFGGGIKRIS